VQSEFVECLNSNQRIPVNPLHSNSARSFTLLVLSLSLTLTASTSVLARGKSKGLVENAIESVEEHHSFQVPARGSIEVAFSPSEGSEHLVIKTIDSAQREIRMLAYSFTSAPVTKALLAARHRGVRVILVADQKNNVSQDRSGRARAALSALVNAGCDVRTISAYPIHHDKVVIVDAETVELGSFNYSDAAARKNSENVLVNWHNPQLAKVYLEHFARNYHQSRPYETRY
jgi:phosphatidylserine/phosphatidylglycerophosphate/cardiolipin synthase-like enzyme